MSPNTSPDEVYGQFRNACVSCHSRKVKCDRLPNGCTRCDRNDIPCRYPSVSTTAATRKQRGPYRRGNAPRKKELEQIVHTLTTRCANLERRLRNFDPTDVVSPISIPRHEDPGEDDSASRITPTPGGGDLLTIPISVSDLAVQEHCASIANIFESQSSPSSRRTPCQPVQTQILELWHLYMTRVEPLVRLLHYPSFAEQFIQVLQGHFVLELDVQLLMFSIYLAAVNSLTDDEALQRFAEAKPVLSDRLKKGIQATLGKLNVLSSPSTCILQALVIQAVCLYRQDGQDEAIFMETFRLALQVINGMDLRRATDALFAPHDTEIRRRCWWTLCRLQYHCVEKRGSVTEEGLLSPDIPLPLNVNDVDLSGGTNDIPLARLGLTEMSFFLATLEVARLAAKLELLNRASNLFEAACSISAFRQNLVRESVAKIVNEILPYCDTSRPSDWFLMLAVKATLTPVEIMMLDEGEPNRPPSANSDRCQDEKEDKKFLLLLDVVECWHVMKTNENIKPYRWFLRNFHQTFTVVDLAAELQRRPLNAHRDRAHALMDMILCEET